MKPVGIIGVLLIVLGIIALAYGGFSYTKREKIVETPIGDITAKTEHTVPFPPMLGGICLVGGIILVIVGSRKA